MRKIKTKAELKSVGGFFQKFEEDMAPFGTCGLCYKVLYCLEINIFVFPLFAPNNLKEYVLESYHNALHLTPLPPTNCQQIVYQLLTKCHPNVNQWSTNCQPIVNQLST